MAISRFRSVSCFVLPWRRRHDAFRAEALRLASESRSTQAAART